MHLSFRKKEPNIFKPKLVNAVTMHEKYPETPPIPTNEAINDLNIGDYVKVINNTEVPEPFWIKLGNITNNVIIGKINNKLSDNSNYESGSLIYLKRNNICSICKDN